MVNWAIGWVSLERILIQETAASSINWSDCAASNNVISFPETMLLQLGAAADPSGPTGSN